MKGPGLCNCLWGCAAGGGGDKEISCDGLPVVRSSHGTYAAATVDVDACQRWATAQVILAQGKSFTLQAVDEQ